MLILLIFIGKSLYTTLPGFIANWTPFLMRNVNFLNYPLDFGLTINGKPALGKNKTFRGLFFGVLNSMIAMYIIYLIEKHTKVKTTLIDFSHVNVYAIGFFMGLGVIFGDMVKSFIKRRVGILPGNSFFPWDQLDAVLGGLSLGRIVWAYSWQYAICIILSSFILHILIRHSLYYLKVTNSKW